MWEYIAKKIFNQKVCCYPKVYNPYLQDAFHAYENITIQDVLKQKANKRRVEEDILEIWNDINMIKEYLNVETVNIKASRKFVKKSKKK